MRLLPFADIESKGVTLSRMLRLSLFQISAGISLVLLTGVLNRVMIVELKVPAWLVATMVAIPLVFAPFRALIGHRSDVYRSVLGWRRVPFIWIGTMLQFGGLAIMPFALLILSGDTHGPMTYGYVGAALAFLLVGVGLHTSQTAGLALATDVVDESNRSRVVALLFVMLLIGMSLSSVLFGWLLANFSQLRLIQTIQGAAVVTIILNTVALWKQEPRRKQDRSAPRESFASAFRALRGDAKAKRLLLAVALGTAGFAMQDILLEPFGGQILDLSVSNTSMLTGLMSIGMLVAFLLAARRLQQGTDPHRLSAYGMLVGIVAFAVVTFVGLLHAPIVFAAGVAFIGFGNGLFAVGTLTAAMDLSKRYDNGFTLGAWGAVQATAGGLAIAGGGALRDVVSSLAERGVLGETLANPVTGYAVVYQLEILLLFSALAVIGPLAAFKRSDDASAGRFGIADYPS